LKMLPAYKGSNETHRQTNPSRSRTRSLDVLWVSLRVVLERLLLIYCVLHALVSVFVWDLDSLEIDFTLCLNMCNRVLNMY
jgi:hypothetical protein